MSAAGSKSINVTPLIDVLLVLLIIFLVLMPIMLRAHLVELPHSDPTARAVAAMVIRLDADLSASLDDGPAFPVRELGRRLRPKLAGTGAVFVEFADGVQWDQVIAMIDTVRGLANSDGRTGLTITVRLRPD